jgi:hypothetical protein
MNTPRQIFFLCIGLTLLLLSGVPTSTAAPPKPADSEVFELAQLDTPPELKKPVKLRFRKKGVTGEVTLKFIVTKEGKVRDIMVPTFNDSDFVEPAFRAYEGASYTPGMRGGVPVATRIEVKAVFPEK